VPITLSINGTPAEPLELKIKHTLRVDLNWNSVTGTFGMSGPGGGLVQHSQTFWVTGAPDHAYAAFDPSRFVLCGLLTNAADANPSRTVKPGQGVFVSAAPDTYVSGSLQRSKTAIFPSSTVVGDFRGVSWFPQISSPHSHSFCNGGFKTIFTTPTVLNKPIGTKYTQKFSSTWGRV
jgi:hypothetical protein